MMGQRSTPLRSPKVHSTADSHHENNPSKSPAQNSAQASNTSPSLLTRPAD
ncbi:hypothetical protein DSO57_1039297 [Entomophthora muscae]|uniref:Uncharacterized protein n=1 Tax=Entomophthora muscae TaxID=34485 RepID=A0ACC2SYF1_9FUNG|nr:hypothetical protein DSO57_1039297 [Entomophthora muscae]